ncbi:MAG: 30S ribosomal protein S8 [bacterium]|nr:30S ribosomal protein S8 [bacterium]
MDPIANMLIALKNASMAKRPLARVPYSQLNHQIIDLLKREGYVEDVTIEGEGVKKQLVISLAYTQMGVAQSAKKARITGVTRVSKPSRRTYLGYRSVVPVRQGKGMVVISTPQGLKTDKEVRKEKHGGEVLFKIW